MKRTREEIKAQLLAEAEMVIDELLDWNEGTLAPNLNQLEETILALRKHMSRRMAEIVLGNQEAVRPVPGATVLDLRARDALQGDERGDAGEPGGYA